MEEGGERKVENIMYRYSPPSQLNKGGRGRAGEGRPATRYYITRE